jgi:hypothetical protein
MRVIDYRSADQQDDTFINILKLNIMVGILVPILLGLGLFAMIFGIRYLQNKENMAMIQNGLNPKEFQSLPQPYRSLKWGLLLMGAGTGLFLAYLLDHTILDFETTFGRGEDVTIYFALVGVFGGLGLLISFFVEKANIK